MNRETLRRMIVFTRGLAGRDGQLFAVHREARNLGVSKRTLKRDMAVLAELGYVFEYDQLSQMYWAKAPKDRIL